MYTYVEIYRYSFFLLRIDQIRKKDNLCSQIIVRYSEVELGVKIKKSLNFYFTFFFSKNQIQSSTSSRKQRPSLVDITMPNTATGEFSLIKHTTWLTLTTFPLKLSS